MSFKIRDCQWEVLLQFMEDHRDFATGKFVGQKGRETQKKLWSQLAANLNSLGYGEKTPCKWQKTWSDFKYQIKKKGGQLKVDQNATGGGVPNSVPFNSFELRALAILGGENFYLGVGSSEVGVPAVCTMDASAPTEKCTTSTTTVFEKHLTSNLVEPGPSYSTSCNAETLDNKEPTGLQDQIRSNNTFEHDDHAYGYTPPVKKIKLTETDRAYRETIIILKQIKNSIDDLKNILEEKMGEIAEAIKNK